MIRVCVCSCTVKRRSRAGSVILCYHTEYYSTDYCTDNCFTVHFSGDLTLYPRRRLAVKGTPRGPAFARLPRPISPESVKESSQYKRCREFNFTPRLDYSLVLR